MSHPTFWAKKSFFYPIGNTPPVSLTDHLPPESAATILLLGCGDPRHILYTVSTDHGFAKRSMDFTCCDMEPAVIARNALLFTLLYDSIEANRLLQYWSIFYELFLDNEAASLLSEQCTKLVNYAVDLATWHDSPYGSFLKFITQDSLSEARRHWSSYCETIALLPAEQKRLRRMFLSGMKDHIVAPGDVSAIQSAAPLSFQYSRFNTYTKYWTNGITDLRPDPNTTTINPTFLFSMNGRQFNLHYGTDLCTSFHLALAAAKHSFDGGPIAVPAKSEYEVWNACRDQFSRWSKAVHERATVSDKPSITIRLVIGEALAFCEALQLLCTGDMTPTIYSSPWGAKKFKLDDPSIPTSFNVVDTSNLSDSVGPLNILTATVPLLRKCPYTALHINSLISHQDQPTKISDIKERMLLDFPSLAVFFGMIPMCYSSGLSFRNGSESAIWSAVSGRHSERIAWRFSEFTHAKWDGTVTRNHLVRFEHKNLGDKLVSLYMKMFEKENIDATVSRLAVGNVTMLENPHYHRRSFVRFIKVLQSCGFIEVDWRQAINHFLDQITMNNDLIIGPNNLQNLYADLHIWGVYSETPFLPGFVARKFDTSTGVFRNWESIPPVVCVVLKVPRSALSVLEDVPENEVSHPILECETFCGMQWQNYHSSIRPIFGDIIDSPTNKGKKIIVEDEKGFSGKSPLVISFFVSSFILAQNPDQASVGLCIKSISFDAIEYMKKLGPGMCMYSAKLMDEDHVFVLPERPDNEGELKRIATMNPNQSCGQTNLGVTMMKFGNPAKEGLLCKRLDVIERRAKEALKNKARVEIKQVTPFCMEVIIGNQDRYSVFYPVPVDGSRSKTRIARTSSYIEIDLPLRTSPFSQTTLQPFPVARCLENNNPVTVCWNTPYMKLESLPTVSPSGDRSWIASHLGVSQSLRERQMQRSGVSNDLCTPMANFKMSLINTFLLHLKDGAKVHILKERTVSDPFAVVFLSSVRFDLSSATIVGDAVVVMMESSIMSLVEDCMGESAYATTAVDGDEIFLWTQALPVYAERCRQWRHLPTCEYFLQNRVPLSFERGKSTMCSCGKGKNLGTFPEDRRWRPLIPHATRIALTPVFPVTYLEDVSDEIFTRAARSFQDAPTPTPAAASASMQSDHSSCRNCAKGGGESKLFNCGGCRSVKYCSKGCQNADWKRHKVLCKFVGKGTA